MVSSHSNITVTKAEVGKRDWDNAVTDLNALFVGEIWQSLGLWTSKAIEHSK